MDDTVLRLEHVAKSFLSPAGRIDILKDVSLAVHRGESVAIAGQSGSGKSTLMSIAALMLAKDSGKIFIGDRDADCIGKKGIEELRRSYMGFVFQSSLLLEDFSALENVAMPLMIQGIPRRKAEAKALGLLDTVLLKDRAAHRPAALSGGERQRVAIARALSASPSIIFADEPTGALDERNAADISELLFRAVKEEGSGLLVVTHNRELAESCDRILRLKGGEIEETC